MKKSLKLDHPRTRPAVVRRTHMVKGRLVSAHASLAGYGLVDFGDGNPVNVRMNDGTIGWAGAEVIVQTSPDGSPMLGSIAADANKKPAGLQPLKFGPTAEMIIENEEFAKSISDKTEEAKRDILSAQAKLAEAEQRITAVVGSVTDTTQAFADTTKQISDRVSAHDEELFNLSTTATRAVEQANSAVQSAAQLAGLVESRGKTIISAERPPTADEREGNIWIQLVSPGVSNTHVWQDGKGWIEVNDDSIEQAAKAAIDAQAQAKAAEDAARQAQTEAAQAKSEASRATSSALQAMQEAKKAHRKVRASSLDAGKQSLEQPYRNGDTIEVGGDTGITSIFIYTNGRWAHRVISVDNLVVNEAFWARLVQAEHGEISDLIVKDQASIRRLLVTGESILKNLILTGQAKIAEAIISKLTVEKLNALKIKAGSLDLGPRVKADSEGIRIFNENPDTNPDAYVTTQLTGNEQSLGIAKNGLVVGGFNSDGDLTAQDATVKSLNVEGITLAGVDLQEVLDNRVAKPVAYVSGTLDYKALGGTHAAQSETMVCEVKIHNPDTEPHLFQFVTSGIPVKNTSSSTRNITWRATLNKKIGSPATQPGFRDYRVDTQAIATPPGLHSTANLSASIVLAPNEYANICVFVSAYCSYSFWSDTPFTALVTDVGAVLDAAEHGRMVGWATDTGYGGSSTAPNLADKQLRSYTWKASSFRTFTQYNGEPNAFQARKQNSLWLGPTPNSRVLAHDGSTKGIALLGGGVASTLRGAEITRVQVYVRIAHGYYSSGNKVRVYPGGTGSGWGRRGSRYREITLSRGQGAWFDMTSEFKAAGLASGSVTNVVFDPDGSRDRHYYANVVEVQLKVTYKK